MDLTVNEEDMKAYIDAVIFMSINPMVQISQYWSTKEIYHICLQEYRVEDLERYLNFFIFHFPQKKLLAISFARLLIYQLKLYIFNNRLCNIDNSYYLSIYTYYFHRFVHF